MLTRRPERVWCRDPGDAGERASKGENGRPPTILGMYSAALLPRGQDVEKQGNVKESDSSLHNTAALVVQESIIITSYAWMNVFSPAWPCPVLSFIG